MVVIARPAVYKLRESKKELEKYVTDKSYESLNTLAFTYPTHFIV